MNPDDFFELCKKLRLEVKIKVCYDISFSGWVIRSVAKEVCEVLTRPPNGRNLSEYKRYNIDIAAEGTKL